jgi:hypothetical protein
MVNRNRDGPPKVIENYPEYLNLFWGVSLNTKKPLHIIYLNLLPKYFGVDFALPLFLLNNDKKRSS